MMQSARLGEKTAAQIAQIYARSSSNSPNIDELLARSNFQKSKQILSEDKDEKLAEVDTDYDQDSESSNSDRVTSYQDSNKKVRNSNKSSEKTGRDLDGFDFASGRLVDQFDMSRHVKKDRNFAGSKDPNPAVPVSSMNFEFDAKERSPKMINSNSDHSNNFENFNSTLEESKNNSTVEQFETTNSTNVYTHGLKSSENKNVKDTKTEETKSDSKKTEFDKIDTSLFDISDDNIDGDILTWRPMRLSSNGQLQVDASEVISTSNPGGETIVTVLQSDSWIPNGGPIMSERD